MRQTEQAAQAKSADVAFSGTGQQTIVAIHGIQGTRASWQPLTQALHDDMRWILPNLRGRAAAFRGNGVADYTLEKFAGDIVDVIERHVDTPHYILAGWSMGVSVALATIDKLRQRSMTLPQAMILMSGSPVLRQTSWFCAVGQADLLKKIAEREQRLGMREPADRDAVAWTWQAISGTDQRALLSTIDIPTLIVHGSADEDSPWPHAQLLAQGLPRATLCTIDGGMHNILTHDTPRVAEEVRTFLSDLARLSPSQSSSSQSSPSRSSHEKQ
jgi:pimeloyl-ACP methyl ester carboxylesterase